MDYNLYKKYIREIQDFPIKGVNFKDITPLLEDAESFRSCLDGLVSFFKDKKIKKVVGIESRGFLLAAPAAYLLNAGIAVMRKTGKLPHQTIVRDFDLEYGRARMEMHIDSIMPNERVIIIDDVIATGGTAMAAADLVKALKGELVGLGFLVELSQFKGRERFKSYDVCSLIVY